MEALERASSVPERLGGAGGGQSRPRDLRNVKRRETPGRFGRQGRLGKEAGGGGAAWAATSKGPRGVPGQLAPLALLRAPD